VQCVAAQQLIRYYDEFGGEGEPFEAGFHATLAAADAQTLDRHLLRRLSKQYSVDFATIYFLRRVNRDPVNDRFQSEFQATLAEIEAAGEEIRIHRAVDRYTVGFVPGYGYEIDTTTGADFARQRELMTRLGVDHFLFPSKEYGTVEENADIVADTIREYGRTGRELILVSASKGGPEAALALGDRLAPEECAHVKGWISVGGLLRGTIVCDLLGRWYLWPLARFLFWYAEQPFVMLKNLSRGFRAPIMDALALPEHLLILHYVGAPTGGQIDDTVRYRYKLVLPHGPNDGLTLLTDELLDGGIVVTEPGLDHFFRAPDIDLRTLALAEIVIDELERRAGRTGTTDPEE